MSSRVWFLKDKQNEFVKSEDTKQKLVVELNVKTGDLYIDECFKIDFTEEKENRHWQDIPEAQEMIREGNAKNYENAIQHARELSKIYPDYDLSYYWLGRLYADQNKFEDSKKILLDGLRYAKSKVRLCDRIARTEYHAGNLPEAVKWWIRSMIIRIKTKNYDDPDPFLYLWYISEGLGLKDVSQILSERSSTGLTYEAANLLRRAAISQGTNSMKNAIIRACKELL
jgi:tetratricopeptide (TPR) repeat protein